MLKNLNCLPTSSPESLGPEAAASSSYSLGLDDRFKGKLNASDLDAEALFNEDLRKQEEAKQLAQMEEAQLAQLVQDDLEAYLNQRPDEYGKDPNGNLLPPKEDLYDRTLNEARHEREATSLTDLATAAGEALARGDKTMADDLQDEILQRLIERAETYDLGQEAIDQRIRQLTKIMDNAEKVAQEKAAKAASQRTLSFPATPQAPESAPAAESEPTQTVPTAPVKPVRLRSSLQTPPELAQAEPGRAPDLMRLDELQVIINLMRERDAHKKEPKGSSWSDAEKAWHRKIYDAYDALITVKDKIIDPATPAENRRALLEKEKKLIAEIDDIESNRPDIKTTGHPVSGEDGNDDEVLDVTCLLRAEDYKKNMDSANWYSNAYKSASKDASPEKRSQLLMVSKWYNNRGTIYAGLRDTQLALANPSISSDVRQALIGKERTLINLLKDSENYKPKYDPSLDLAVYNNGEPNSQSEQNKNGGGEQPESKDTNAGKENGEKWRRFKKFGEWFIRVSGINEPTSSIDTTPKSSDGTGNTVDQEQRVKVKVPRKQPLNPIPKRQVRRKSSTNATN